MFFLTILRRIQADIFESSVRRRQNRIDNVFICVNFANKDFGRILSTGRSTAMPFTHNRNVLFPVKGQMIDRIARF